MEGGYGRQPYRLPVVRAADGAGADHREHLVGEGVGRVRVARARVAGDRVVPIGGVRAGPSLVGGEQSGAAPDVGGGIGAQPPGRQPGELPREPQCRLLGEPLREPLTPPAARESPSYVRPCTLSRTAGASTRCIGRSPATLGAPAFASHRDSRYDTPSSTLSGTPNSRAAAAKSP